MIGQADLIARLKRYDPSADEAMVRHAYDFAVLAHGSQVRASGDPYYSHPVEVAVILTEYGLDTSSIVTALLHDTLEDTEVTFEELTKQFGLEIAQLVDGVSKLSQLELQSDKAKQAENFRKLVLAMSRDIRVLLVKLADRLHNMRTLCHIGSAEKRGAIARETMEIYSPLAERIGMHTIKDELEDLAFSVLNEDARNSVQRRLEFLREREEPVDELIIAELKQVLANEGIAAEVSGREKTPYAVWRKMQRKNITFEQLFDVMAFRIIVDEISNCYLSLGVIHGRYPVVPGRFKDYISVPKPNGYSSLHTGILGPERQRIEIQIRTREMHEIAERGVSAHWQYKHGTVGYKDRRTYRWLQELLEILESAAGPEEFLEHTRLEMFQDQVFCFSPKGDVFTLPSGATIIDFAYAVHSEVGDHCVGGKINGKMLPLRTMVQNGDQVEVLTSKNQTPSPEWEQIVVTGKARSRVRRFVRMEQRREYVSLGRAVLDRAFSREGQTASETVLKAVLEKLHVVSVEDLYSHVGAACLTGREVVEAAFPTIVPRTADGETVSVTPGGALKASRTTAPIPIKGLIPGVAVHFAKCCYPLLGDRIVGIITTGKGVTIHTIDCDTLASFADTPERWIDVTWDSMGENSEHRVARIKVVLVNEPGSLSELTTAIAKNGANISNLKITNRTIDFFDILVDVEVRGRRHFANMMATLRSIPGINSVERVRG